MCYIYMWQANSTWACMYVCLTMSEQKKGLFVDYSEWSMYSVCTLIMSSWSTVCYLNLHTIQATRFHRWTGTLTYAMMQGLEANGKAGLNLFLYFCSFYPTVRTDTSPRLPVFGWPNKYLSQTSATPLAYT